MLIRISLIVAILAGLGIGVLNFVQVKEKIIRVRDERDTEKKSKEEAQSSLAKTKSELDKTTKALKSTQQELASTKTERDKAVAEAALQIKKANDLSTALEKATAELKEKSANLEAYVLTRRSPQEILAFDKMLKQAQDALDEVKVVNAGLQRELTKTQVELNKYTKEDYHVPLPNLQARVVGVDPKWDFVVLDVGEDQGMLKDGEMLVKRDGRLVAKIFISSVKKDRCIANIVPGVWRVGDVMEGDVAIPQFPPRL